VFEAVIFDMDGVLIDSEPIWQDVELAVLGRLGVPLTREMCRETMGFRVNEAVAHWYERHPWKGPSVDDVADELVDGVIRTVGERGELKDGAGHAVTFCAERVERLAICSSSYYRVIDAVLDRTGLRDRFAVVHSAEDEERGKPDPACYLTTAAKLGVTPEQCLAIEDSPNGVLAATGAAMTCLAVPEPGTEDDPRTAQADLVLGSLADLDDERWRRLASL
jgi:sugar-phosphatase